jgi:hypoxanthine-DNA glycosylase
VRGEQPRLTGLAPLGSPQPRLLILGTFPSPMSRQRQEYYGNPANRFWRLLSAVFGVADRTGGEYVDKIKLLAGQGIALWDVVASCEIVGASDNKIKNPVYNDIPAFLSQRPTIRRIILNGSAARRLFETAFPPPAVEVCGCLSTSPANQKYGAWPLLVADWSPHLSP